MGVANSLIEQIDALALEFIRVEREASK